MERVADVLRSNYPQFNTIAPDRSLYDALHQMHCENVDHLIVLEEERFLGLLTEHGITEKIIYRSRDLDKAKVKDFMTTYLPVATMNDSFEQCMQLMERHNTRHIAIYDRFDFKGIITMHDLMKKALTKNKAELEVQSVRHGYPWNY